MYFSKAIQAFMEGSPVTVGYQPIKSEMTTGLTEIADHSLLTRYVAKTAGYTVVLADQGRLIDATLTWTLVLPSVATALAGFSILLKNSGTGIITIDPNAAELIDGAATITVPRGYSVTITCDGTGWGTIWHVSPAINQVSFGRLQADYTLTSTTAGQQLFNWSAGGALTLGVGFYAFRCLLYITGMSATSGNGQFRLKGAGTATLGNVLYHVTGIDAAAAAGLTAASYTGSGAAATAGENSMVLAGTGTELFALVNGSFPVTVAGTIVPSIGLVTAAAAAVKAGSYFMAEYLGPAANTTQGAWS